MKRIVFLLFAVFCLGIGTGKGQYTVLHNFNDTLGGHSCSSLTLESDILYGMTTSGGANNLGCIFSIDTNGNRYKDLLDFNGTNGNMPNFGQLVLCGEKLYGMTLKGGAHNKGIIFSIDTNGSGYKDFLDFNGTNGAYPYGSLTLSKGILYGMTAEGGTNDSGLIFSIDTNGGNYKVLLDFDGTNGANPTGSLTISRGVLYGMTNMGGSGHYGCICSIDTSGSNYRDLYNFTNTYGGRPFGSLTLSGSLLYGMAYQGGVYKVGCIFSLDTNGSGYTDLFNFDTATGANPFGSLILVGDSLYGMPYWGGRNGSSCIFSVSAVDGGHKDLFDFDGTDGGVPEDGLILSGKNLYGTTCGGGPCCGVIFSFTDNNIATSVTNQNAVSESMSIYPNPTTGIFTISFVGAQNLEPKNIEIYNVLGEQVLAETLRFTQGDKVMDLSEQPSGVYFYRVVSENGELVGDGKLIIQK
jgi:uncharacterized repeat protein (TIGR03803 family)